MKFFMKDFYIKCDQICRKLQIWSHLPKESLMKNFFFLQCNLNYIPLKPIHKIFLIQLLFGLASYILVNGVTRTQWSALEQ